MVIITTILKITLIPCTLALIVLIRMSMRIIFYERIVKFIKKYKAVEAIFEIMVGVGITSSFFFALW